MTEIPPDTPRDRIPAADGTLVRWLWRAYLHAERFRVAAAVALMALEGAMLGVLSYIVQPMFDQIFIAGNRGAIGWIATVIGGIFLIRGFAGFGRMLLLDAAGLSVVVRMQRDMVAHLLTLDSRYFQLNPPGTLIERVRGDTMQASTIWATVLSAAGRDFVGLVALLAVALSIDVVWTAIAVVAVPAVLGPMIAAQRFVRRRSHRAREAAGRLSVRLDEIFHGIDTVKLNTSETRERDRFSETAQGYFKQEMRARLGRATIPVLADVVAAVGFAGVLVYGGNEIIDGDKTVGEFMSFFTAMGLLFEPVRRIAGVSGAWATARASLERIRALLSEHPTILSPARPEAPPLRPEVADIVFEDVHVRYGEEPALDGASFTARARETTALVGASGAGKSTVFNALTRLVDPVSGRILVGGVPTTSLTLGDLRALFSVVTQDAPMFDESLRDNIVLNTPDVTEDALAATVEAANLTDVVARLPQGLDTPVGPRGSALSGGQRQRVAIARALLRNAPILLLDEATSALDAESEARVQAALDRLSEGRTTLVIAHRLSTIRRAHKIVVFDRGRVIDEGRHDDLLERGGLYSRLHALQFAEE